ARGTSRVSRRLSPAPSATSLTTRPRLLSPGPPASALAGRPAPPPAPAAHRLGVRDPALGRLRPARRLQQLQGLHVDQVLVLAGDVGVAHRLEELGRAVEVVDPHPDAAESLRDVA